MNFHSENSKKVLCELGTSSDGLTAKEAEKRLLQYGKNEITEKKGMGFFGDFIAQFKDFLIILLLFAAAASFVTALIEKNGEYLDCIIILLIVVLNAFIGAFQERRAEKATRALKNMSFPETVVIRDREKQKIDCKMVCVGDLLCLSSGDYVCADARIISSSSLYADESALTGESLPVLKDERAVLPENTPLGEQKNMLFSGSFITGGNCTAVVVRTGGDTNTGKIASLLNENENMRTPLQKRLSFAAKLLSVAAIAICFFIFVTGIFQNYSVSEMFLIAISLSVAAIPEGLPAIVSISLAIKAQMMAKRRVIVRNLSATETLGCATVICSDKTGTLTHNKMKITRIEPFGMDENSLLRLAVICSNSYIGKDKTVQGNGTEKAILEKAVSNGINAEEEKRRNRIIREIPFSSERKMMSVKLSDGRFITKGAPDILIKRCTQYKSDGKNLPLTAQKKKEILSLCDSLSKEALRLIAVADGVGNTEEELCFCGILGMEDPIREEAKKAVATCKRAGIKAVMITGDYPETALAVAKKLGIANDIKEVMTGSEISDLTIGQLARRIRNISVFARVTPEHKVRIVKAFKECGEITAMTGDGVNDAPALKTADIGCAMGKNGTDVAKSAADMILTDDDFSSIVYAVESGRGIYDNIRKAVHFLISCNMGEITLVFLAFLFGLPCPLPAIQLLFVNLITDSLPALSLSAEKNSEDTMKRPPISPKKGIFSDGMGVRMLLEGLLIGIVSLIAFKIGYKNSLPCGRTMALCVICLSQLFHCFNMKSEGSILNRKIFNNVYLCLSFLVCFLALVGIIYIIPLANIFKVVPLPLSQFVFCVIVSLAPVAFCEILKLFRKR